MYEIIILQISHEYFQWPLLGHHIYDNNNLTTKVGNMPRIYTSKRII